MTNAPTRKALTRDPSFRAEDQSLIAVFVAQLDDQARRLAKTVEGLGVADLEWQPRAGRNSAGMLLAHNAMTEVFWTGVATGAATDRSVTDAYCREILGVGLDDDGMPAAADGGHPAALAGWELARYLDLLERARRHFKAAAAAWRDADLGAVRTYSAQLADGSDFRGEYSREWILYHMLEHYAQHAGQVGLVLALRRAAD
jgi:hypothetical protein